MKRRLDDVLTVQEAAAVKQVDESSVRRALQQGRLKGERRAKVWLILRRDLSAWEPERRGPKPRAKGQGSKGALVES